jgi:hypothetical protein
MTEPMDTLRSEFGEIDFCLFDQLHRGRIASGMRVLDAGRGGGRNLVYLLRQGFEEARDHRRARVTREAPGQPAVHHARWRRASTRTS